MLYTLNIHSAICQSYLNISQKKKTGDKEKENILFRELGKKIRTNVKEGGGA